MSVNFDNLNGKLALSIDHKELGKIVSVKKKKNITSGKNSFEIVIHHTPFLQKEAFITITIRSVKEITEDNVVLKISSDQFKLKVEEYHFQKKTFKKKADEKYHKRVRKGLDRGYYYKKEKGEW